MKIRVGIEGNRAPVMAAIKELSAPVLVSANSLWSQQAKRFKVPESLRGLDVALDSGGFIAMRLYGGYRWSSRQYASLAADLAPTWWAQMDYCCEPELASNRAEVFKRIELTVEGLHLCQDAAKQAGIAPPMPVLQGWEPRDYCQGPAFASGFDWPAIVGVGSVCRRPIGGSCGVLSVMSALHHSVPKGVRFHLFGVKSEAIGKILERWPDRLASVDSMAWHMAARWDAVHSGQQNTNQFRAERLRSWYRKQIDQTAEKPFQFELSL